jgi:hypothetical protein
VAPPRAKRARAGEEPTAGRRWFDMPAPEMTAALRRDLTVLRHRAYLDPKRHYKTTREDHSRAPGSAAGRRPGGLPRFFQVGTVVESGGGGGAGGLISSRAQPLASSRAKADHPSLVAALLADEAFRSYARRNVEAVQKRAEASRARAPRGGSGGGRGGARFGGRGRGGGGGGKGKRR